MITVSIFLKDKPEIKFDAYHVNFSGYHKGKFYIPMCAGKEVETVGLLVKNHISFEIQHGCNLLLDPRTVDLRIDPKQKYND